MNILVTGANGQLGQCLRDVIKANGNGEPNHFVGEKNYWIFAGRNDLDITDSVAVDKFIVDNHICVVVNCAAYTNVDKAESDEVHARQINVDGAKNLAEACEAHGVVLIHISTDYVFDGKNIEIYSTHSICNPLSVYGRTKREGELAIVRSGCKYLIFRTSWLHSQYGKNFVKTIYSLLKERQKLFGVNDEISAPTCAISLAKFIYHIVEDFNSENNYLCKNGIYHFTDMGTASRYDMMLEIAKVMKKRGIIDKYDITPVSSEEFEKYSTSIAKRPKYSVMDISGTMYVFDMKPNTWESMIDKVVGFLNREDERRARLEAENSEFDYGHNITHTAYEED